MDNRGPFMPLCMKYVGVNISDKEKWCCYSRIEPYILHTALPKLFIKDLHAHNNDILNVTICSNHEVIHICRKNGQNCEPLVDMDGITLCRYTMLPIHDTSAVTFESYSSFLFRKKVENVTHINESERHRKMVSTSVFREDSGKDNVHDDDSLLSYPCNYESFHKLHPFLFGSLLEIFPLSTNDDVYDLFCNIYRVLDLNNETGGSLDLIKRCINNVLLDITNGRVICEKSKGNIAYVSMLLEFEPGKKKTRREQCVKSVVKNHIFYFQHKYRLKEKEKYSHMVMS